MTTLNIPFVFIGMAYALAMIGLDYWKWQIVVPVRPGALQQHYTFDCMCVYAICQSGKSE